MARDRNADADFTRTAAPHPGCGLVFVLAAIFLIWRIDSPRVERFRAAFIDRVVPNMEWAAGAGDPSSSGMVEGFQSYAALYEQNQELRRELQQMKSWKEAAVQLEQQNAKLLAQNKVRLDPKLTSVSGVVLADAAARPSGSRSC